MGRRTGNLVSVVQLLPMQLQLQYVAGIKRVAPSQFVSVCVCVPMSVCVCLSAAARNSFAQSVDAETAKELGQS